VWFTIKRVVGLWGGTGELEGKLLREGRGGEEGKKGRRNGQGKIRFNTGKGVFQKGEKEKVKENEKQKGRGGNAKKKILWAGALNAGVAIKKVVQTEKKKEERHGPVQQHNGKQASTKDRFC